MKLNGRDRRGQEAAPKKIYPKYQHRALRLKWAKARKHCSVEQ